MKNKFEFLRKLNLNWLLVGAIILLVADPLGILGGNFSNDSYSQIRNELSRTKNAKVQLMASWDDFYSLEYNNYWRAEINTEFVERDYGEVRDAASLGDDFFNKYIVSNNITHILVPESSATSGRIFHKFGTRGTIDISLSSSYFKKLSKSSGPYASVLFQVINSSKIVKNILDINYSLTWVGVDSEFYEQKNIVTEVGMYRHSYSSYYENGPEFSWFYDQTPIQPGYLELKFDSSSPYLETVNMEIELLAAYGPNAPSHVVIVSSAQSVKAVTLTAGNPQKVSLRIANGQSMKISNETPCRVPSLFEPLDTSLNKICFGFSALRVTPVIPVE